MRRVAAAGAVSLLVMGLTPGTAHTTPSLVRPQDNQERGLSGLAGTPLSLPLPTSPTVSRDWRRPALNLAVGVSPAVTRSQDTTPARLAARPVPRALAPTANPTPNAPTLPRRSVTTAPSGSSAATAAGEADLTGPRAYALSLVGPVVFRCLDQLWTRESNWRVTADNPNSTAYGIAQLLTETSTDWHQQILHGISYIRARYQTACAALAHSLLENWY